MPPQNRSGRRQGKKSRGPYYYRRDDRPGLWAYLDRYNRNIPLGTDDEQDAPAALARIIESRKVQAVPTGDAKSIADLFEIALARAHTNSADKTAYDLGLDLERVLGFLQGIKPGPDGEPVERNVQQPSQMSKQIVEDYKSWRMRSSRRRKRDQQGNLVARVLVSERRINCELSAWRRALTIATEEGMGSLRAERVEGWFQRLKVPKMNPHQRGLTLEQIDQFFGNSVDWRETAVFPARRAVSSRLPPGWQARVDRTIPIGPCSAA